MLLQRLKEYADCRLSLPPTLYNEAPVRYIIELDSQGNLLTPEPTDTAEPSSPRTRRGQRRSVPLVQRSSGVKPLLLADNSEYTFGLAREASRPDRVSACHLAYLDLLEKCLAATQEPAVEAVHAFLNSEPALQIEPPEGFDRGATTTFRVDGVFPIDLPAVQSFWAAENDPGGANAPIMQCLVCGQERPVLERLQAKIKGVPGGQTAGTSIISANAGAFESYGLTASLIAPTCSECGEAFTQGINQLLANPVSRLIIGGSAFIFWTQEKVDFDLLGFFNDPRPDQVRDLLASVRTGRRVPEVDSAAFFGAVLSGSGGRAVVRDWIDTTVGQVKKTVARWHQLQSIVQSDGSPHQPLALSALAYSTVRERRDLPTPTLRSLLRTALTGAPLQMDMLYQAVRRNRAEQRITRPRAALIKMVLLSQKQDMNEDEMVQLDPNNPNLAYRCGRLLAVLEEAQVAAIPRINATVVDRFFGTASSAPASVFSRLVRGVQPHLAKLKRDNPGAHYAIQNRLDEILGGIPSDQGFPKTLTLEGQGFFSLGYYHQRAHDRAQMIEAAEGRRQRLAGEPADEVPSDSPDASTTDTDENQEEE